VPEQPTLTFSWLLKRLRTEAGFTQEDLARAAGMSPRTISDLERGIVARAQRETITRLAAALQLDDAVRDVFESAARSGGSGDGATPISELRVAAVLAAAGFDGSETQNPLGIALRQLRSAAHLTLEDVAERLHWSATKLSRVERGQALLSDMDLDSLTDVYGVDNELKVELRSVLGLLRFAVTRKRQPRSSDSPIIPAFAGETAVGDDVLGIEQDAAALALLLAANSLTPPLALGLFGDWGSGKTFFMKTLERNIANLTTDAFKNAASDPAFCKRVVSVWFNAWHYADSDLWASLVHQIFVSIYGESSAPEQEREQALAKVKGIQELRLIAAAKADAALRETERARVGLSRVVQEHERAHRATSDIKAQDVWDGVSADAESLDNFNQAARQVGIVPSSADGREAAEAVAEANELLSTSRLLAATAGRWKSPLITGLGIAVLISVVGLAVAARIGWTRTWVAPALGAIAQVAAVVSGAVVWLTRQASMVRQVLQPAEQVRRQLNERLARAQVVREAALLTAGERLEAATSELAAARQALANAEAREAAALAALDELTGARLLQSYLSKRLVSDDYSPYLGAVALAYRDLSDLDAYLRSAAGEDGPAERIILYIDDLDRCTSATVVKVLEAVHLLLALPLFVVVVGVDARWLARSLNEWHPVLVPSLSPGAGDEFRPATSADYLDKIFQLSYELPKMTPQRCADLLTYTAKRSQPGGPAVSSQSAEGAASADAAEVPGPLLDGDRKPDGFRIANQADQNHPGTSSALAEVLALDPQELELLKVVAPLVDSSPRRAKRFLNVYRIVRARASFDSRTRTQFADNGALHLMILIALAIGFPDIIPRKLASASSDVTLREWLDAQVEPIANSAELIRLSNFCDVAEGLIDIPVSDIEYWIPLARPHAWPPAIGAEEHLSST
jgi:transcriptional regulator with XRE-family HTH domain